MTNIKDKSDNEKLSWFFKNYIYPQKTKLLYLIALIFIGSLIGNISPYLYGKMLDSITSGDMNFLTTLIVIYFLITVFTTILSIIEGYVGQKLNFTTTKSVQKEIFDKMIRMKTTFYTKYETGEFINRLNGDADGIVSFFIDIITSILYIVVNIAISLYFVLTISIHLSTVSVFYIPASFAVTYFARKHFKELAEKRKVFGDKYYSFQNEVFSNNTGIKSYMLEESTNSKYVGFIQKEFMLLKRSIYLGSVMQFINNLITVISSLYVIYLSAVFIKGGILTIGMMVSFNTYINKFFASVSQVLGINISKQQIMVSLNRIIEIMSQESEENSNLDDKTLDSGNSICSKEVYFKYNQDGDYILNDFTIEIPCNGFYSIVGKNGCGKSTVAKILIKLYDAESGNLTINNKDYKDISYSTIRRKITYVQKEDFFYNDTIINNVKVENSHIKDEDIINMCKKVELDDFINTLPQKYDTVIGEGGSALSSGQKQKLSIVRALLRDTDIYVFDEITANLDGKSENNIISILKELSRRSIVIFISHRASSIIFSDKIFVMDEGKIIGSGTHQILCESSTLYNDLFRNSY